MLTPDERQKVLTILGQMATLLQTTISCGCKEFSGVLKDFQLSDPPPPPPPVPDPCDACKDSPCKDNPDGKIRLLICDGKTLKTWIGTADGQYPAWDNTGKQWYLANV